MNVKIKFLDVIIKFLNLHMNQFNNFNFKCLHQYHASSLEFGNACNVFGVNVGFGPCYSLKTGTMCQQTPIFEWVDLIPNMQFVI
jgi:hypothetical protein